MAILLSKLLMDGEGAVLKIGHGHAVWSTHVMLYGTTHAIAMLEFTMLCHFTRWLSYCVYITVLLLLQQCVAIVHLVCSA